MLGQFAFGSGYYADVGQTGDFTYNMVLIPGTFATTGSTVTLYYDRYLTALAGGFNITGFANLRQFTMNAIIGNYNLVGFTANLAQRNFPIINASYAPSQSILASQVASIEILGKI